MSTGSVIAWQAPSNSEKVANEELSTKRKAKHLDFLLVRNMIQRFLTCDRVKIEEKRCLRYSTEELAERLEITPDELERFKTPGFYKRQGAKITLAVINLYCATKWVED